MTTFSRSSAARGTASLAILAACFLLTGCSLLGGGTAQPTPTPDPTDGVVTDAFAIAVGDCVNDGGTEDALVSVAVVDCALPHDSEAFLSIPVADGAFPGLDAITAQADQGCLAGFATFAGISYDLSTLGFWYFHPTETTWASGDREILCLIQDPAGQTTGTLAGAQR
jgi:hypothetical protein